MAIQAQLCSDNFGFSLGGPTNWMDSGYGFNESCFNLPQRQNSLQRTQNPCFQDGSGLISDHKNDQDLGFPMNVLAQIEMQRLEVDRFICLQVRKQSMKTEHSQIHGMRFFFFFRNFNWVYRI